jgi:folate-dependent phosphoribosylglycinamide formyltransferase PurN
MKKTEPRIALLLGNSIFNRYTAAEFINSGLNVVAIVHADKRGRLNKKYLKIALKKYGFWNFVGQILERLRYKILSQKKDEVIKKELFNENIINKVYSSYSGKILSCFSYEEADITEELKILDLDFIVIHTPFWVGKKVRQIPRLGVIGGHPGITPYYRGVHSPFWALLNGDIDKIGYTVFWVDSGVDTGDVIDQGHIEINARDSYVTLSWRGMIKTCASQIAALKKYEFGEQVPRMPHHFIPENSNYGHPSIFDYIKYRKVQNLAK